MPINEMEQPLSELTVEKQRLLEENRRLKEQMSMYKELSQYTPCTITRIEKKEGRYIASFMMGKWTEHIKFNKPMDSWLPRNLVLYLTPYFERGFNGEIVEFETQSKNNYYYTKLIPYKLPDEKLELIATTLNITKQKRAEKESSINRKKFLAAFQESLDGILIFSDEGKRISANRVMCELVGQSEEEFLSHRHNDIATIEGKKKRLVDLMNEGKLNGQFNLPVKNSNVEREIEYRIKPNILPGVHLGILRDISDRINLEKRLSRTERIRTAGALAVSLAHEIRNPLTSINGFLTLLKNQKDTHSMKPEFFSLMFQETETIQTLVNKLLLLAEPPLPNDDEPSQNNAVEIIEETIDQFHNEITEKQIVCKINYSDPTIPLYFSKEKIQPVLSMIIHNSLQSMEVNGHLEISLIHLPDGSIFRIKDNGAGIPEHILQNLGEPFYEINEKGTGLELMICYHIIESYGGSFTVDSEVNKGTIVTVYLPEPK